jgi:tetratricopeptide (TPR) repeat protein
MAAACLQTSYWRNSKALWTHMIDCYPSSGYAHNCLGAALLDEGQIEKAKGHFETSLGFNGNDVEALARLGVIFAGQKNEARAVEYLCRAIKVRPDHIAALHGYALVLAGRGETEKAIATMRNALAIEPDSVILNGSLGAILARHGDLDAAVTCLQKASEGDPKNIEVHNNLGMALLEQGRIADALRCWQEAVCLDPQDGFAVRRLAWMMATQPDARFRNASEAVKLAEWAVQLSKGQDPLALGALAAAYAEAGRFPDAVKCVDRAIAVAETRQGPNAVSALRTQREQYRKGKPFRE